MNKTAKRSIIVSAVLAIIMCVSLVAGATFALFTSESKVNISVSSGKVNVVATVDNLQTYSGENLTGNKDEDAAKIKHVTDIGSQYTDGDFVNGGKAEFSAKNENTLLIQKMTPGDKVTFDIKVQNNSNVAIQYRTIIMCEDDNGLFNGLTITLTDGETASADGTVTDEAEAKVYDGRTAISEWAPLDAEAKFNPDTVHVAIELTSEKTNEYQDTSCILSYKVEAVQGNAAVTDPDEKALEIYTAADLKWFQKYASTKNIRKTYSNDNPDAYIYSNGVKLMADIDLKNQEWDPINWNVNDGSVFDGQDHTISNFVVKENKASTGRNLLKNLGLFGSTTGIHIKNLKVNKATVSGINRVGAIVGFGLCTYIDKCVVTNSVITATATWNECRDNNTPGMDDGDKAGAIVGQLSAQSSASMTNCTVDNCTVKAYRDLGGLAGHVQNKPAVVQNNKVSNTTVIHDLTSGLEVKNTIGEIVGRQDGDFVLDTTGEGTKNTADNVTITILNPDGFVWNTTEQRYEISNVNGLKFFRDKINDGTIETANKTFLLTEDIDLAGENWMPIGNETYKFEGTFDGGSKTISNLKSTKYAYIDVNNNQTYGTGLFGYVKNGTVKNLVIEDANVGEEYTYDGRLNYGAVGIITGYNYDNSTYDSITIKNSTVMAQTKVGAIIGLNATAGQTITITNCKLEGVTVKGNYSYSLVAGLINSPTSTINMTGTTVDENSKTEFWTSDICEFKGDNDIQTLYTNDPYTWELSEGDYCLIKCNNAWAVQRYGDNNRKINGVDVWDCGIYTGANSTTDKVEYFAE